MKTYNDIYLNTRNVLRQSGVEAYSIEAKLIVSKAAGKTVAELMRDLRLYTSEAVAERVTEYTARRLSGEPIAYISGSWEFYGLPVKITQDVLIPRPETELIVDTAKKILTGRKMDARVLDLCTGSGCIACAIGHELPATHVLAVDISAPALEVARKNAISNRLGARVICMQADALAAPPLGIGKFDVIVSNPPYVPTDEIPELDGSVKDYEPVWALDGGKDGLDFYRGIIKYWKVALNESGYMVFEVGEEQAETVAEMLRTAGFRSTDSVRDAAGTERIVIGRL